MKNKSKKGLVISLIILIPLLLGATVGILFSFLYKKGYEVTVITNGAYGEVTNRLDIDRIPSGSNIAYVISPYTGYEIKTIQIDEEYIEVTANSGGEQLYVFYNMSENHTIKVDFVVRKFAVTFKNPDGTILQTQTVEYGKHATLPAGPAKIGYTFTGWLGKYQDVKSNVILTPAYTINTFGISINAGENGQILPDSAIVEYGENITFTIKPDLGYNILYIKIDDEEIDVTAGLGQSQNYTFLNVTESHTITAEFEIQTFSLTVTQPLNGAIIISETVEYGDDCNIYIMPDRGYFVSEIKLNGQSIPLSNDGTMCAYVLENVTQNYTITVTIELLWGYDESTQRVSYLGSASSTEFTIPSTVTTDSGIITVNEIDFQTISTEIEILNLPKTLTRFESGSISHLKNLKKFTIQSGGTFEVSDDCLYNNSGRNLVAVPSAKDSIVFNSSITTINSYAFENSKILEFAFPNAVTSVGDYCFKGSSISKIIIINGDLYISPSTFSDMIELNEIEIYDELSKDFSLPEYFDEEFTYGWNIYQDEPENATNVVFLKNAGIYIKSDTITGYSAPRSVTEGWGYEEIDGKYYLTSVPEFPVDENADLIIPSSLITANGEIIQIYSVGYDKLVKETGSPYNNYRNSLIISYGIKRIGNSAFASPLGGYNPSFQSIRIPNSIEVIGDEAFLRQRITSVVIPNSVKEMGQSAFHSCTSLSDITILPEILDLGFSTFYNTAWYNSQPDGLVYLGENILMGVKGENSLSGHLSIDENVKIIVPYAISNSQITSITLPEGLISIGAFAFSGCQNLTSITIPDSVKFIGRSAFEGNGITSITLPKNVMSVEGYFALYEGGGSALEGISSLTEIIVSSENNYLKDDNGVAVLSKDGKIFYQYANMNTATSYTIPDGVEYIKANAFYNCQNLESITMPTSLKNIESMAFYSCSNLKSITIPANVTSIEDWAFSFCTSLTSVIFEENSQLTSIGDYAFSRCDALTSIIIPSKVETIGKNAFSHCKNLETAKFESDNLVYVDYQTGNRIFENCTKLTKIYVKYNLLNNYSKNSSEDIFVGFAQLEVGDVLSTQTGHIITWYASEEDLINNINGIVANGIETATQSGIWYVTLREM